MGAYEDTVAWLQALEGRTGWDLKLERMRAACAHRGHPERRFEVLHVGGTNGKGSTAAIAESVLRAAGWRTGLFTSPHLVDFAERIRAGGRTIPREAVVALVAELRASLAPAGIALTHFEMATLLAFEWFALIGVEAAVVEVGLGGRLDATNVVEPLACAITAIALDHEEWLGPTLGAIAGEKAGILKPGVPAVVAALEPEAAEVVERRAATAGVPVLHAGREVALVGPDDALVFRGPGGLAWDGLRVGLPGAMQRRNAEVALGLLALAQDALPCRTEAVRRGLAAAAWPGRLAVVGEAPRVLLDGAHNPAGVEALLRELPVLLGGRPVTLVAAMMADKAWAAMLARLGSCAARAVVTRVGRRGADPATLAAALPPTLPMVVEHDPRAAVRRAVVETPPEGAVLVAGSLFLVGEAYQALRGEGTPLFEPWNGWDGVGRDAPR